MKHYKREINFPRQSEKIRAINELIARVRRAEAIADQYRQIYDFTMADYWQDIAIESRNEIIALY